MATAIQDIPLKTIKGEDATLADYAGQVLLAVNVASKCGLTPQYTALEALHRQYRDRGFAVLGFPANNFGAQEPGSDDEIQSFCTTNFGVDFPMFSKLSVKGDDQHPLYRELVAAKPDKLFKDDSFRQRLAGHGIVAEREEDVLWNFEKFLIAKDGTVAERFAPDIAPDDAVITTAIERELGK